MSVDWSQFRDGDRVRVVFEGTWYAPDQSREDRPCFGHLAITPGDSLVSTHGALPHATSAELIERPFVAPEAGKLFRSTLPVYGSALWISTGDGYFRVRMFNGAVADPHFAEKWSDAPLEFTDAIEVIDA